MRILITGILGQDGSFLADLHLRSGHQVWGTTSSSLIIKNKEFENLTIRQFPDSVLSLADIDEISPDRIYHMAAKHFSSTAHSREKSRHQKGMFECHVLTTQNILEWQVRNPRTKSLIALSSQMYKATSRKTLISENSSCDPQNYYGCTKWQAMELIKHYRETFGIQSSGAILFNHTSTRSKSEFLFPKLAREISHIISGRSDTISLKDTDALIDICHAEDICQGLKNLLDSSQSVEMIFSSGKLIPITEIVRLTMARLNFHGKYSLQSFSENSTPKNYIYGDPALSQKLLGWRPNLAPSEILLEQVNADLSQ